MSVSETSSSESSNPYDSDYELMLISEAGVNQIASDIYRQRVQCLQESIKYCTENQIPQK